MVKLFNDLLRGNDPLEETSQVWLLKRQLWVTYSETASSTHL